MYLKPTTYIVKHNLWLFLFHCDVKITDMPVSWERKAVRNSKPGWGRRERDRVPGFGETSLSQCPVVFQDHGQHDIPLCFPHLQRGTWKLQNTAVYILFILLDCSPSPPFFGFMNFSYFRTQIKHLLLDDKVTAFLCLCNNSFCSLQFFREPRLLN